MESLTFCQTNPHKDMWIEESSEIEIITGLNISIYVMDDFKVVNIYLIYQLKMKLNVKKKMKM